MPTFGDGRKSSIVVVESPDADLTSLVPLLSLLHRAEAVVETSWQQVKGARLSSTDREESDATVSITTCNVHHPPVPPHRERPRDD